MHEQTHDDNETDKVYVETRKCTVNGFIDRNPYGTKIIDDTKHVNVPFSGNKSHKLTMHAGTLSVFEKLFPRPIQTDICPWKSVHMLIDIGSKSIWDATFDTLREICALSMFSLVHREIPHLHTSDIDTVQKIYRPILVSIAKRIRQHINVIIVNDTPSYSHTLGSVSVISTIPSDDELSVELLASIKTSMFIYVVLSNSIFYTVVVHVCETTDRKKRYSHLHQSFLLTRYLQIDNDVVSFYTRFIPSSASTTVK